MATIYRAGQTYRIRDTFRDEDGVESDPTSVQLRIGVLQSDGTLDTLETYTYGASQLTKEDVGVYSRVYTFPQGGTFVFEFTTTGVPTTVDVSSINVEQPYEWA